MAKNDRAVNMSELRYQANLVMILQFWLFLGTTEKETPKFTCKKFEKRPLCCLRLVYTQCVTLLCLPFVVSYCLQPLMPKIPRYQFGCTLLPLVYTEKLLA